MKSRILEVCVFCFALALKAHAQTNLILSEPQSATNNIASAADFNVVATNAAAYQWQFDGANLAGETNATLSLDDLTTNQAGSYTVVVTSSNNYSVTSTPPAVLTIVPGTIIQWTISTYPGGGSSNFLVQLFDHDKPATVVNFLHYVSSGAYSNMFFDRDVTNFVLQGGDYIALAPTTNGLNVTNLVPGTNFPSQVDNEFGVGPLIHNTFGTLAMALHSGETNSASSSFFFNLVDNSSDLDSQDFTVFGRILYGTNDGSNVLQYFNTLGAPSNGIVAYSSSNLSMPTLPVNYDGTNAPTNANLFYCGFQFISPTSPPVITNLPAVAITYPSPSAVFTNPGTLTVQGTAQDTNPLAEVFIVVTLPTGQIQTNAAIGLTNWSVNIGYLQAGTYQLTAYAQDAAGNLSAPVTESFTAMIPTGILVQITFSGFADGSSSNVLVQLFNQERPATVANFIHYITPASYFFGFEHYVPFRNMIWDRCIPGFILQGGDFDATDQTNQIAPLNLASTLYSIDTTFTENSFYSPPFASQVDNESGIGPPISNTFGTLAMALRPGDTNSARGSFFFNLTNNAGTLDSQDYTVFGRLVSGSNVLQYFNTLSKPDQGIFDSTTVGTNQALADLPVNYDGPGLPANSNLYFATFTLLSTYNADTNLPTITVNSPTNGQTMTNADLVVEGAASDDVGVANVVCSCVGSNFEVSMFAIGTTNWSADFGFMPPGQFTNYAYAQNGAGNESVQTSNVFIVPRFPFAANIVGHGTVSPDLNGTNATLGAIYTIKPKPGSGSVFANWVVGTNVYIYQDLTFLMGNGLQFTANFVSNDVPGGISITNPASNAAITNATLSIKGKLSSSLVSAQVSCRVFSTNGSAVTSNMVIQASNNTWATPEFSLTPGEYTVQAIAQAADGRAALVDQQFVLLAPLTVIIYGRGTAFITNGSYLAVGLQYTEGAEPAKGESFFSWNDGSGAFREAGFPFVMTPGLTYTLTLISNTLPGKFTITSPAANAQLTNPTVIFGGNIPSQVLATQVLCQLFRNNAPATGFMPATITGTSWTLPVTNLSMGIYSAVAYATGPSGNSTVVSQPFEINFFPRFAGAYSGLFFDPAALSETTAGAVSFRVAATQPVSTGYYGTVNGNLIFPLRNYSFSIHMDDTGATASTSTAKDFAGSFSLFFDVTNFSGQVNGFVTVPGGLVVPLTAYRTLTKLSDETAPSPGNYVLSLQPQTNSSGTNDGPSGDSFAAVTVSANGNLAVAGTLADDSSFSQSTGVFTNGAWPFYAGFYKGNGMLIGWETNLPSGESAGALYWIKNRTNGLYYTNGLNEQLNSVGTNYHRPTPNAPYQIVFGGGTLTEPLTNMFSFNAGGAMVPTSKTNKLTGSLVLSTGVIKGSIVNPFNNRTLDFSGVFLGPLAGGSGFTLDADAQTGYFDITPFGDDPDPARQ